MIDIRADDRLPTDDRPTAGDDPEARDGALLRWAAQTRLAEKVGAISDFAERPLFVLGDGPAARVAGAAELGIDPKSAALFFRSVYLAHVVAIADRERRRLERLHGATRAEFGQALLDFDMLAADARRRRDEDADADPLAPAGSGAGGVR